MILATDPNPPTSALIKYGPNPPASALTKYGNAAILPPTQSTAIQATPTNIQGSDWSGPDECPQLLMAQVAPPGKIGLTSMLHSDSECCEVWVSDNAATMHMTQNGDGMYDCVAPSVDNDRVIVGGRAELRVEYYGKLDIKFHASEDVIVTLLNVAYVPQLGFNLFSLHAMQLQEQILLDSKGVHVFGGQLVFPRGPCGSKLSATRMKPSHDETLLAAAVLAPGSTQARTPPIDVNVMHVCYGHVNEALLRAKAKQLGIVLKGELSGCAGCSMAKGKRLPIPKTTMSRSTKPLERVFIDLAGPKPMPSAGGANYIMLLKDDYTRYGWIALLRQKSDATAAFSTLAS